MSAIVVQQGTYSNVGDLVTKFKTFIETNGWTVKSSLGGDDITDPLATGSRGDMAGGDWHIAYSDAASNPNTDWLNPGNERIYFVFGKATGFSSVTPENNTPTGERLVLRMVKYADISAGNIASADVIFGDSFLNQSFTGGKTTFHAGFHEGNGSSFYHFVTDGSPTVGGSRIIVAASGGYSNLAFPNCTMFFGMPEISQRSFVSLGTVPLGGGSPVNYSSGAGSIDLGVAVPAAFDPATYGVTSVRLRIVDQSIANSANSELIDVTSVAGTVLTLSGPLTNNYTDPVVGLRPKAEVLSPAGNGHSIISAPNRASWHRDGVMFRTLYHLDETGTVNEIAASSIADGAISPVVGVDEHGGSLDSQTGSYLAYQIGLYKSKTNWQYAFLPDVYSTYSGFSDNTDITMELSNGKFQAFRSVTDYSLEDNSGALRPVRMLVPTGSEFP